MFTGLVAAIGTVAAVEAAGDGARLSISTPLAAELADGDSVAVDGVCLTAREVAADRFAADAMAETMRRSALGALAPGDAVNLELALAAAGRLGGHVVQGHVDGVGTVVATRAEGFARVVAVAAPESLLRYVVEKGSIAVAGVSLTVSAVDGEGFEVSLIPETLARTTLGEATPGRTVNLEADVLAKYVEKLVNRTVEAP